MAPVEQATLTHSEGIRPLRGAGLCLIGALLTAFLPMFEHAYLYGLVLLLAGCVVFPIYLDWSRGRLDYFEPIHLVGLIYFVYFGLGAIWTVQDPMNVAYDLYIVPYVPQAVLFCLLGYLTLLAGYYLPWGAFRDPEASHRPIGVLLMVGLGGVGLVGFMATRVLERAAILGLSFSGVVGGVSQLAPLFFFAWALGWLLFYSKTGTRQQRWVLYLILVPSALMVAYATTGDKSILMTLIGVPIIARWYCKRKVPWTFLLVLLLILMFAVFPLYNSYRWLDANIDQVTRLRTTVENVQRWDSSKYMRFSLGTFKRRMAMVNSVAVIVRDVGRWEPYQKGETIFKPMIYFAIPRIVWPDKPLANVGKDFGRRFRVTDWRNSEVLIGVTVPGELYWNFDVAGIMVGMGLIGIGMRYLYRRYGESRSLNPIDKAIHIVVLINLAHFIGGAIAPALVAFIRTLVMLEICRLVGRHFGMVETVGRDPGEVARAPGSAATR